MPELSIIVPVYRVEKYLPKCIDSILAQTFSDFELIMIDDGSPDKCGEICDEYAAKDSRIKVIHQENQGVSAARNAGLDIASGTYLGFVDSDDWIKPEMYEIMISTAKEKNVDVVVCGINYFNTDDTLLRSDLINEGSYNKDELLTALFGKPNPLGCGCVNKIFLREKVGNIRYNKNLAYAEDWAYIFENFQVCEQAYKLPNTFYNVVEQSESATRKNEVNTSYKLILSSKVLLFLARNYSRELECIAIDKFLDNCVRYSNLLRKAGEDNKQHWRWKYIKARMMMLKVLPRAYFKKLLSKEKIHGYFYAMIKN